MHQVRFRQLDKQFVIIGFHFRGQIVPQGGGSGGVHHIRKLLKVQLVKQFSVLIHFVLLLGEPDALAPFGTFCIIQYLRA